MTQSSQPIRSHVSPNFKKQIIEVEFVILHYTAQDLKSSLDIFLNPTSQVSCHLLIDEVGQIYELVSCWNHICYKALHAGKSFFRDSSDQKWESFNDFSIGIEMVNPNGNIFPYTTTQYDRLFQVLNHLKGIYPKLQNPKRILGHEHIAGFRNKSDPGYLFDWNLLFQKVYHTNKPAYIKPLLNSKQYHALSFVKSLIDPAVTQKSLQNHIFKSISLILETKWPFWFKIFRIKLIVKMSPMMKWIKNQKGQLIVEYMLLLVVSVAIALILLKITNMDDSPFSDFWIQTIRILSEDIST